MFNKLKENIKDRLKDWLDINKNHEYAFDKVDELLEMNQILLRNIDGVLKSAELDRNSFTASIKRIDEKLEK
jgi:hypothetical protein